MNKVAILDRLSPEQVAIYSLLGGGGAFGAAKLLQDVMTAANPSDVEDQEKKRQLPVYIPSAQEALATPNMQSSVDSSGGTTIPQLKMANENDSLLHFLFSHVLTGQPELTEETKREAIPMKGSNDVIGASTLEPHIEAGQGGGGQMGGLGKLLLGGGLGVGGFMGAKYLYDKHQEDKLNEELNGIKQQYAQTLQQAKGQKLASSETPCLDGFCTQLEELVKQAEGAADPLPFWQSILGGPKDFLVNKAIIPFGLMSAAGTAAYLINSDRKRREAEMKKRFPEDVVLADSTLR